ncbi:MAG: hypothetical protein VX650_07190 [Actinomycetota bacterium]|nr:hypothetical protein [Actinomycetota bacterium]
MFTASKLLALLASLFATVLLTLVIVTPRGEADTPSIDNPSVSKVDFRMLHEAVSGHQIIDGRHQEHVLQVANTIPAALQPALKGTKFVNGCHPWATKELDACAFGTYDPEGWDSDDTHGHDWANTIWVSSHAVRAGKASDVILHEVGHAVVHNLFDDCYFPKQAETTVKELLLQSFAHGSANPAELLADAFVVAFSSHSDDVHTHYFENFNFHASKEVILKIRAAVWLCSK